MRLRTKLIAIGAAVAVLAAGAIVAAGYVGAQEPDQPKESHAEALLAKVAGNLGVTTDELKQAFRDAQTQTVDELLAEGRITAEQAAHMKERIASSDGFGLGFLHRFHDRRHHGEGNGRGFRFRGAIIESAAKAIGIDKTALVGALRDGKSIAEVAAEHGVSVDDVKAGITADAKAQLDQAVANGRISQAKADEMLKKLTDMLDDVLNKKKEEPAPTG